MSVPIRPEVAALPAYRAGKPARPGPDGRAFKLSSNENPFPPLPAVQEAIAAAAAEVNRYPDPGNTRLAGALGHRLHVSAERLSFGTGSVALFYAALQTVCRPGDEVVTAWRSFEAYPIGIELTGARHVRVPLGPGDEHDLSALAGAITERTRCVVVCTPNNPTGPAVRDDDLAAFLDRVPERVLVIIDEAYREFVTDPSAARGEHFWDRPNVVVLRTFSKAFGLAGLRVGYAVSNRRFTEALRAVSLPFGVPSVSQAAAVAALQGYDAAMALVGEQIAERDRLLSGLRSAGWELPDSQANFVWFGLGERSQSLAESFGEQGLMVRAFPGDGLRVSIGEPEANRRVLAVATDWLAAQSS